MVGESTFLTFFVRVHRLLLFPRCPRNGQGIGIESGNAPNHTPGKIKTSDEREEGFANYWECAGGSMAKARKGKSFFIFFLGPFVCFPCESSPPPPPSLSKKKSTATCREYRAHHSIIVSGCRSNFQSKFFSPSSFLSPFSLSLFLSLSSFFLLTVGTNIYAVA